MAATEIENAEPDADEGTYTSISIGADWPAARDWTLNDGVRTLTPGADTVRDTSEALPVPVLVIVRGTSSSPPAVNEA